MENGKPLTDQEAAELNQKLAAAKKNSNVQQQKVKELNAIVDRLRAQRQKSLESIAIKNKKLEEKDREIKELTALYEKTNARLQERKALRDRLTKELAIADETFGQIIQTVKKVNKKSEYGNKEVTTNYTSQMLSSQRGYNCKPGSTFLQPQRSRSIIR